MNYSALKDRPSNPNKPAKALFWQDALLLGTMIVLAGCGLIYEYLLSHYAGRVIGMMEMAIYAMIGVMIVFMGFGSLSAKWIKRPFTAFVYLELAIAFIGALSVLVIGWMVAFINILPQIITDVFALPEGVTPNGDVFLLLQTLVKQFPYVVGAILGFLIGMEIPLIARVREELHQQHLVHNTGTIYGADYVGAGIGAAIWIALLIGMETTKAAGLTASANLVAGLVFLTYYRSYINNAIILYGLHFLLLLVVLLVVNFGDHWMTRMNNLLFQDQVVHSQNTRFQHLTITERRVKNRPDVLNLYLNGRLQFSSNDEHIYHSMLVHPAMAATGAIDNVLIIGGGDGLALREVLKWPTKQVELIDLDRELVDLFAGKSADAVAPNKKLTSKLTALNGNSLNNPRVNIQYADAFIAVDELLAKAQLFNVIIVDLPDPNHPDLNKLYSDYFYNKLKHLLRGDGVLVVQSTSPYHAKNAFIAIGKTLRAAGFGSVEQYHQNIPSFGEWGWSIVTKEGPSASARIKDKRLEQSGGWLTPALLRASFAFPLGFYANQAEIQVNQLGSNRLYQYHYNAWRRDEGLFYEANDGVSQ